MAERDILAMVNSIEQIKAKRKIKYWQIVGSALLEDMGLADEWCDFVEMQAYDEFERGALIDESLQILSMINAHYLPELIAEAVSKLPEGRLILTEKLVNFVHPDILKEIKVCMDQARG